jgi:hypothetical protein
VPIFWFTLCYKVKQELNWLKLHFSGGKTVAEDYLEIIIVEKNLRCPIDQRSKINFFIKMVFKDQRIEKNDLFNNLHT